MSVYITGMGAVCTAGNGVDAGFNAIFKGFDFLRPYTLPDIISNKPVYCAAVDCDLDLLAGREGLFRSLALAVVAADEAMGGLCELGDMRLGVVAATTVGGISQTEQSYRKYRLDHNMLPALARKTFEEKGSAHL